MAEVAEITYNGAAKVIDELSRMLGAFFMLLGEHLQKKAEYRPYKEMGKWLSQNKDAMFYKIDGDCEKQVIAGIEKAKLPYYQLGKTGMLVVRAQDIDLIRQINKDANIVMGNNYCRVDRSEMENAIAQSNLSDKNIFTLKDLSYEEAVVISNKFNGIGKGFLVGMEEDSATHKWSVSFLASKLVTGAKEKKDENGNRVLDEDGNPQMQYKNDGCKAILTGMMSYHGVNRQKKNDEIISDRIFDEQIEKIINNPVDKNLYIVSCLESENKKHYIEISNTGFELYEVLISQDPKDPDKKAQTESVIKNCSRDDINFSDKLNTCLFQMRSKAIVSDRTVLTDHILGVKMADPVRQPRTEQEKMWSRGEDILCDKIDRMTKEYMESIGYKLNSVKDKNEQMLYWNKYVSLSTDFLSMVCGQKEYDSRFKREDLDELMRIADVHNLDVSQYTDVIERMKTQKCEIHLAQQLHKKEYEQMIDDRRDNGYISPSHEERRRQNNDKSDRERTPRKGE